MTTPIAPRSTSSDAGVAVDLIADLRDEAVGPLPDAARAAGIKVAVKTSIHEIEGRTRIEAVRLAAHPGGMRTARLRRADHVGRLDAVRSSVLAVAREARL